MLKHNLNKWKLIMGNFLKFIDHFFCKYIGVHEQELTPVRLKINHKKIYIVSTESFKRHSYSKNINEFISNGLSGLSGDKKIQLGSAVGKAIAKNLTVSFENIEIKKVD